MDDVDGSDVAPQRTWKRGAAMGVLLTGLVLAIVAGIIAGLAQRAGQDWMVAVGLGEYEQELYSLPLHVAAMAGTGMVAVVTAAVLMAARRLLLAFAVLVGTVAGPMTIVAAPVSESLIRDDSMDTTWGWHLLVGAVLLAVLGAGTWWTSRSLRSPSETAVRPRISSTSLFLVLAAVLLTAQVPLMGSQERPQLIVATGWSLLIAGQAVVGTVLGRLRLALGTVCCGAVLLLMALAYIRVGGWPGVAGWEFKGMQSPVILTWITALGFVAGPLLGFLTKAPWRIRHLAPVPVP